MEYVRLHINDFVGSDQPHFNPHPSLPGDAALWQDHTLGSILGIGIPIDAGSVILSDYSIYHWTFTTIYDPINGAHPVSGNRTFGCTYRPGSSVGGLFDDYYPVTYTFYIRGADRINYRTEELVGSILNGSLQPSNALQFSEADRLWVSMQNKVAAFVNNHGGVAQVETPIINRPDWQAVKAALENNQPLNTVPCY